MTDTLIERFTFQEVLLSQGGPRSVVVCDNEIKSGDPFIWHFQRADWQEPTSYERDQGKRLVELLNKTQAQAIATLTAERDAIEVERVKLWNEKRDISGSLPVAQAATDTLGGERDKLITALDDLADAASEFGKPVPALTESVANAVALLAALKGKS